MGLSLPDAGLTRSRILHTGPAYPESTCLSCLLFGDLSIGTMGSTVYCAASFIFAISWQTISQINPISSRAMATHTSLVFLPAWVSVR